MEFHSGRFTPRAFYPQPFLIYIGRLPLLITKTVFV
nr:MAG TPA: hypothetical protein [Crassvirales sp.]DAX57587.1 MAG TPA: hypothetical protein [Crassvirales sp.]DAX67907.1 MAG TPA: hypothetical protein [Crassvirales sp.]